MQVGARTDLPLTAFGKEQARKIAELIRKSVPKAIFAGGLKRQIESAEIIAERFGLTVQKCEALTEIDYGLWEGLAAEAIAKKWPREHIEWSQDAKWQDHIFGSRFEEHWQKLEKWLNELRASFENKTVFGVTSSGILHLLHNEKVSTGHFCEMDLCPDRIEIVRWNFSEEIGLPKTAYCNDQQR